MNEMLTKIDEALKKNAHEISLKKPQYDRGRYDMAYECLDIVRKIIQSTPIEPTVTINLPSLSAEDVENCKAQLKELFDEKDRYEQMEHDGCVGCVHEDKQDYEYPCKECQRAYTDEYKKNETVEGE